MKDTIIKGSGNSRSIRFPPNALTIYPDWPSFVADASSQYGVPCDIGPLNLSGLSQKGDDLNKANLLTDATAELLGLDGTAVPNDALMALYAFSKGMAQIKVTVHDASGNPFANIPVTGLTDVMGNTPVFTNAAGVAVGYSMSGSKTFSTANILDLTSVSKSVSVSAGNLYEVELVPARRNFVLFQSSVAKLYITDAVDNVDVSVVSGGENGGNGKILSQTPDYSGKGGNSGTSKIEYAVDVTEMVNAFSALVVGGSNGGMSSFLGVEASVSTSGGGTPVLSPALDSVYSNNGRPGAAVNYEYFSSFTGTDLCGGNGGSGAAGNSSGQGGSGSGPFGGNGGVSNKGSTSTTRISGYPGSGYGGAGGGGGTGPYHTANERLGGAGYKGVVSVRIHFKEGITV